MVVNTYYKYGPTPNNPIPHWYEFLFDGTTGAEIVGNQVILHFVDGMRGDGDLSANGVVVEPGGPGFVSTIEVAIDMKPGSFPNSINLGSKGKVPVAILSSADFDATAVDPLTVTVEGAGVELKGNGAPMFSVQDVNEDGLRIWLFT